MKSFRKIAIASMLGLFALPLAQAQDLAVSAKLGTLGPGLELTTSLSPDFNIRLGASYFTYSHTATITDYEVDIQADTDMRLGSVRLFADYFPFNPGWRLTGGLVLNMNEIQALIVPTESYMLNEKEFPPEKIGTLSVTAGHELAINPYLGIGFGRSVNPGAGFGFVFDLGVMYTGSPTVDMEGTEMIAPTASQDAEVEQDLENAYIYPLLSIGISYKVN